MRAQSACKRFLPSVSPYMSYQTILSSRRERAMGTGERFLPSVSAQVVFQTSCKFCRVWAIRALMDLVGGGSPLGQCRSWDERQGKPRVITVQPHLLGTPSLLTLSIRSTKCTLHILLPEQVYRIYKVHWIQLKICEMQYIIAHDMFV